QAQNLSEESSSKDIVSWNKLPDLPNEDGLAGAFSGVLNSNTLIVAGGANFPEQAPWEGGHKLFHDQIYILHKDSSGYRWQTDSQLQLPQPLAYGATIKGNNGLILMGGTNGQSVSDRVFRLQWRPGVQSIKLDTLPSLPQPLAFMSAARMGSIIY